MKKVLTITALVLAIAVSLAAGTLAAYTKTLNPINGTVTAKQFYIGSPTTKFPDIKLAPGDSNTWDFSVVNTDSNKNVTETNMDLTIVVNVADKNGKGAIDGLVVGLYDNNDHLLGTAITKNGSTTYKIDNAFIANKADTLNYHIKTNWQNGLATDAVDTANADAGASTQISVTVTGTQHIAA